MVKTIAAIFRKTVTITVGASTGDGSGTTSPAPGAYTVKVGDSFTITATPATGSILDGWTVDGAVVAATNPLVEKAG